MSTETATVEDYTIYTATGRRVRTATKVTFADGEVIRFTERMGKREALRQAEAELIRQARAEAAAELAAEYGRIM
jgi:hypothetical protein